MYSRQEASQLRHEFWMTFGQYMLPVLSAEGAKVNWINYKTGEKNIAFRMYADNREAFIGIELSHRDTGVRQLYFEQFLEFRRLLVAALGEEWTWQLNGSDAFGKPVSRIFTELKGVSIFKKEDWPALISFFKPRIMALDKFWSGVKYSFELLK